MFLMFMSWGLKFILFILFSLGLIWMVRLVLFYLDTLGFVAVTPRLVQYEHKSYICDAVFEITWFVWIIQMIIYILSSHF